MRPERAGGAKRRGQRSIGSGDNDLQIALYDPATGGCRDGLHPDRANENQGAESTLSFLMALLEMAQTGTRRHHGSTILNITTCREKFGTAKKSQLPPKLKRENDRTQYAIQEAFFEPNPFGEGLALLDEQCL